ncbi:hypothetical protein MIND_00704900 [Mycena indigotica]|uniref:C3H1-type domain-containing protein n=1 Tax=Mycena indigotica TaxID=2126181 RepID=A0A8H6W1C4_9AGAR|nr:uncharacterized protein MIND_00704900 [Mycena indigotica]KAF7301397.1 hypothetical protein MIND_00704900 [Mycena indigotica]
MDVVAETLKARIDAGADQLKLDLCEFFERAAVSQAKVKQLEEQVALYKLALEGRNEKCAELQRQVDLRPETKASSVKQGFRIVALIDGDGTIFTDDLISDGRPGGAKAAQMLSNTIIKFLKDEYGSNPYQLSVYVFYNKSGLLDALGFTNKSLEEFVVGFNQATRRFLMVDVGDGKEAADAKMKAQLEDNIPLPQTFKIIFGGCHDNGYASDLRSHITAGFRDKVVLLKGYAEMAREIAALALPHIDNAELFRAEKISEARSRARSDSGHSSHATSAIKSYSSAVQSVSMAGKKLSERRRSVSPEATSSSYRGTGSRHINPILVEFVYRSVGLPGLVAHFNLTVAKRTRHLALYSISPTAKWGLNTQPLLSGSDSFRSQQSIGNDDVLVKLLDGSRKIQARNVQLEEQVALLTAQLREAQLRHNSEMESVKQREAIFQQHLQSLGQQLAGTELFKISPPLIFTVINGDEFLFAHLSRAFDGGVSAANVLTANIVAYLEHDAVQAYARQHGSVSYFMTVFYNRRQLLERLQAANACTVQQFDQFLTGFSIPHEGFYFVDVSGLNHTETKIKAYINTFIRLPQTLRVFFAGRRYGPLYRSLLKTLSKRGILGKLVMIGVQLDMAAEVPLLVIDDVFAVSNVQSRVVQLEPRSNTSSPQSITTVVSLLSSSSGQSRRSIDPSLPLHKQNPPPCNEFYLMKCTKEPSQCKYSHEYDLTKEQLATLSTCAKKAPCNWLKSGKLEGNRRI